MNYCWNELMCGFEGNKFGIKTVLVSLCYLATLSQKLSPCGLNETVRDIEWLLSEWLLLAIYGAFFMLN